MIKYGIIQSALGWVLLFLLESHQWKESVGFIIPSNNNNVAGFMTLPTQTRTTTSFMSSYSMDGSEYSATDSEYEDDGDDDVANGNKNRYQDPDSPEGGEEDDDSPTVELKPIPMSKNTGNRFVAMVFDRTLTQHVDSDEIDRHEDRIALTEDHVLFCRKQNLYNATFNTESMVDVLWSRQILSSDLKRTIGHALCMESKKVEHVHEMLAREPIMKMLTGGDTTNVPIYRWRHIRDYTLRQDDGRFGFPCLCLAMDDQEIASDSVNLRKELEKETMEYLIASQRVIAAGPLHVLTEYKDDPSSLPLGDLIMFNAKNREEAISFAENLPTAQEGLYESLVVHFYNNLDVTGKFVSEDRLGENPCSEMKEAMAHWGYPVDDDQTPWLNW